MSAFLKSFTIFSSLLLSLVIPSAAFAQNTTSKTLTPLPSSVSPASPIFTDLLVHNMIHSASCLTIGQSFIGQPCLTYQITTDATGVIKSVPMLASTNLSGGLLGTTGSLIGALYDNPPARTIDYLASVGQGLGIVKEANAQVVGSGAGVLNPILILWQVSRNVAYVVMILVFVIIGLMIMFRQRLNPQTIITAQAALPGLVIGLILITFSYFFAGVITDSAFLGTNLVVEYFQLVKGGTNTAAESLRDLSNENVLSIFSRYAGIINKDNADDAVGPIYANLDSEGPLSPRNILTAFASLLVAQVLLPIGSLGGGVGAAIAGGVGAAVTAANPAGIIGLGIGFMATAILLYSMFRLLLKLLNNYLTILFLVITAPFHFLVASLPGRQGIATSWILNLLSHSLSFPAVLGVFYFVAFLLGKDFGPIHVSADTGAVKSLISTAYAQQVAPVGSPLQLAGTSTFPLLGGITIEFIRILIAFAALIATPNIPEIIQKTIGKPTQAGGILSQGIAANLGAGRGYYDQGTKGASGLTERVGQVGDQPGYILKPGGWQKVTGSSTNVTGEVERAATGFRPGTRTKASAAINNWRSSLRRRGL